ncbi:MAG: hypothetical protein ACK57N_12125 [Planctomycetia bacterium]|jgi:hypothetical protein
MSFAAPALLWLLLGPLALFLLQALVRGERASATLALWRDLGSTAASGAPRPRLAWSGAWLPSALALVVLALAGPRVGAASIRWQVQVDASPRMLLVEDGATRLESALSSCEAWLERRGESADWRIDGRVVAEGPRFDRGALPKRQRHVARFEALDAPGVLWVADRLPFVPRHAGAFVAARAPRPGLVERVVDEARVLDRVWDGEHIVLAAPSGPASAVVLDPGLPEPLADFTRAWAADRGLAARARGAAGFETVLEVRLAPEGERRPMSFDDEGAALEGVARATLADLPLARRELERDGVVWCATEPGVVWMAFEDLRLSGSLEGFGARLARVYDDARWSCSGCAPIEGRAGSGSALVVQPARLSGSEGVELQWMCLLGALACLWPAWRRR